MFVTECTRRYWNSITIRTRRNWATGSQLWDPLLILERSSLSHIPWIKTVMRCFILHFELLIIFVCPVLYVLCTHSLNSKWLYSEKFLCKNSTFYVREWFLVHSVTCLFKFEIQESGTTQCCAICPGELVWFWKQDSSVNVAFCPIQLA